MVKLSVMPPSSWHVMAVILLSLVVSSCNGAGAKIFGMSHKEIEEHSLKAIKAIHRHLDDDQDGDVNLQESNEFMLDELHLDDRKRHSKFHGNDSLISVEDLWNSWKQSKVHNWTTEDVIGWLNNIVGLPQYANSFSKRNIDGRMLPRFTNESSSLYIDLGISNVKHRKKIYLCATDIVLFGPPRTKGYAKDIILTVVVILMTLACIYAFNERKYAKKQIEQMIKDVEFMQQAEDNLKSTQEKLMKAEMEHISTVQSKREVEEKLKEEIEVAKKEAERLHMERTHHEEERTKMMLVEQELNELRRALQKAEVELESVASKSPKSLQQWLHITYKKESKHFIAKKSKALKQMEEAKDACDKIRKKRSSFFGPLRLVHGQTIDDVDQKILQARSALAEVTNDLQERQQRWRMIEELCGFPIVSDGLLGHSVEVDEHTRRSSIAQALAVCANLGGIGSLPDPSRRIMPSWDGQLESPRSSVHFKQNSLKSDSDLKKTFQRNSSLASDGGSVSGRSSPACIVSAQDKREILKCSSLVDQLGKSASIDSNVLEGCTESKYDLRSLQGDRAEVNCASGSQSCEFEALSVQNQTKPEVPSSNGSMGTFHSSQSTPAFSTMDHTHVRSLSLPFSDQNTLISKETLAKEKDYVNFNESESSKDMLSFEIFSSDENLVIGSKAKQSGSCSEVNRCSGSVEELSYSGKESKKGILKSLKSKRQQSVDQISLKSSDGSDLSKRKSIFSKLRRK